MIWHTHKLSRCTHHHRCLTSQRVGIGRGRGRERGNYHDLGQTEDNDIGRFAAGNGIEELQEENNKSNMEEQSSEKKSLVIRTAHFHD